MFEDDTCNWDCTDCGNANRCVEYDLEALDVWGTCVNYYPVLMSKED